MNILYPYKDAVITLVNNQVLPYNLYKWY